MDAIGIPGKTLPLPLSTITITDVFHRRAKLFVTLLADLDIVWAQYTEVLIYLIQAWYVWVLQERYDAKSVFASRSEFKPTDLYSSMLSKCLYRRADQAERRSAAIFKVCRLT